MRDIRKGVSLLIEGTMTIGQILLCLGFGFAYLTMQIIPMFCIMFTFDRKELKEMSFNDWLFAPIMAMVFLIPLFGAILGGIIVNESKWLMRIALISLYIVIAGFIVCIIERL